MIKYLQGIRAFAIFGVFLCHTSVYLSDDLGSWKMVFDEFGAIGVFTFFMLSGFLFAYKGYKIEACVNPIKGAWKKVNKLYGLYIITFFMAFIAKIPTNIHEWFKDIFCSFFNLSMTQAWVPHLGVISSFNLPAWFLSSLFGIWILNYVLNKKINKIFGFTISQLLIKMLTLLICQIIYFMVIAFLPYDALPVRKVLYYSWLTYYNPFVCFSQFVFGAYIGRLCFLKQLPVIYQQVLQPVLLITGCLVLYIYPQLEIKLIPLMVLFEIIFAFGIMSLQNDNTVGNQLLSSRLAVYLGGLSGYFFLIHGPINFLIRAYIETYFDKPTLFFISFIISLLLSIITDIVYKRMQLKNKMS